MRSAATPWGDALAFTIEETRQLLTGLGASVSTRLAAGLRRGTEGWAVALRLAAACPQTGADPDELTDALADDGSPVQYLTARMLDDQQPALRRLLRQRRRTRARRPRRRADPPPDPRPAVHRAALQHPGTAAALRWMCDPRLGVRYLATLTSRLIKLQGGLVLRAIVDTDAAANNQAGADLSNVRSIA